MRVLEYSRLPGRTFTKESAFVRAPGEAQTSARSPRMHAADKRYKDWLRRVGSIEAKAHDDNLFAQRRNRSALGQPETWIDAQRRFKRNVPGHSVAYDSLPLAPELCAAPSRRWERLGQDTLHSKFVCVHAQGPAGEPKIRRIPSTQQDLDQRLLSGGLPVGARRSVPCRIVSIGSANDFQFEEDIFRTFPECLVDTFDCSASERTWEVRMIDC